MSRKGYNQSVIAWIAIVQKTDQFKIYSQKFVKKYIKNSEIAKKILI